MRRYGYTLVELLVVVAVSVLLVSGAIGLYVSSYSELHRETTFTDSAAANNNFETMLRQDLRCLARGSGALRLDVNGQTSYLQLRVLNTPGQGLPEIETVSFSFEKGKDIAIRTVSGRSISDMQLHLPGSFTDLLVVDSIGRTQKVWLWDDIIPKGLVLSSDINGKKNQKSHGEVCVFIPQ